MLFIYFLSETFFSKQKQAVVLYNNYTSNIDTLIYTEEKVRSGQRVLSSTNLWDVLLWENNNTTVATNDPRQQHHCTAISQYYKVLPV